MFSDVSHVSQTLFPQAKRFQTCRETFLLPGKQILFPKRCFPWWAYSRETLFLQQRFPLYARLASINHQGTVNELGNKRPIFYLSKYFILMSVFAAV